MCLLLAPGFFSFFLLLWPLPVLKKRTRQAVWTIEQSVLLLCLWFQIILCLVHRHKTEVDSRPFLKTRQPTNVLSKPPTTNLINIGTSSIGQCHICNTKVSCNYIFLKRSNWQKVQLNTDLLKHGHGYLHT